MANAKLCLLLLLMRCIDANFYTKSFSIVALLCQLPPMNGTLSIFFFSSFSSSSSFSSEFFCFFFLLLFVSVRPKFFFLPSSDAAHPNLIKHANFEAVTSINLFVRNAEICSYKSNFVAGFVLQNKISVSLSNFLSCRDSIWWTVIQTFRNCSHQLCHRCGNCAHTHTNTNTIAIVILKTN